MRMKKAFAILSLLALFGCTTTRQSTPELTPEFATSAADSINQPGSQWVLSRWDQLPAWDNASFEEMLPALQRNCLRAPVGWASVCASLQQAYLDDAMSWRIWLEKNFVPYQIESKQGQAQGHLTAYYEPLFEASLVRTDRFQIPIYRTPSNFNSRRSYYTREQIETLADAQQNLEGRAIAYLENPIDALILQIQGSGLLKLVDQDRYLRVGFAASNGYAFQSVAKWLQANTHLRDFSWASIKAWAAEHPTQVNAMLWSNPRYVFFREIPPSSDQTAGPIGAQGVPLTSTRSVAVDPQSIPYGTLLWASSQGSSFSMNRLVIAQDTGNAITGAVRADYFAGTGETAGELANHINQNLRFWALVPKSD